MNKTPLHITNGTVLTQKLKELNIEGSFLTWQEMLCEGPTLESVYSDKFFELRKQFFSEFYNTDLDFQKINSELNKLNSVEKYSEIVLWFEFDLFCHINLMAVICLIQQKNIKLPLYLVCSGKIRGTKNLKGLAELSTGHLVKHYNDKVLLNKHSIELARTIWGIYCGKDHNLFKPFIVQTSQFIYLNSCLKAHLERFPNSKTGLNVLERNILEIVRDTKIHSEHHLLGYALNYQGYYGYGDLQILRIIKKLRVFFKVSENLIELNRQGHEALLGIHLFTFELNNNMIYGGVKKFDFQFNKKENKLIKMVSHDN